MVALDDAQCVVGSYLNSTNNKMNVVCSNLVNGKSDLNTMNKATLITHFLGHELEQKNFGCFFYSFNGK